MFFLLSTLVAGTDILSYFYQTNIYYGQKLDILFLVFAIWSFFGIYTKLKISFIRKAFLL